MSKFSLNRLQTVQNMALKLRPDRRSSLRAESPRECRRRSSVSYPSLCSRHIAETIKKLIGGYDRYTRIEKLHSDKKIPMLKKCIKVLALNLHVSAKVSRNRYIKKLGADSLVRSRSPLISSVSQGRAMVRRRHPSLFSQKFEVALQFF